MNIDRIILEELHGGGLSYPFELAYQKIMNYYRKNNCHGKARPLELGEMHYGCHNYTGPGTHIQKFYNIEPFSNIDTCSQKHDLDYLHAEGKVDKETLIRLADEEFLKCIQQFKNEGKAFSAAQLIGVKNKLEDYSPELFKLVAPDYYGRK